MRQNAVLFFFGLVAAFAIEHESHAARFMFEMGAGFAQIRGASAFFGQEAANPLSISAAANLGFAMKLTPVGTPVDLHLGIEQRFSAGSDATAAYAVQATYPYLRFEYRRYFVGIGLSPLVLKRAGPTFGITGFQRSSGTLSALLLGGYVMPITPQVSLLGVASGEAMTTDGNFAPRPILGLSAVLRFFFGKDEKFQAERTTYGEGWEDGYPGWRYPFGNQR